MYTYISNIFSINDRDTGFMFSNLVRIPGRRNPHNRSGVSHCFPKGFCWNHPIGPFQVIDMWYFAQKRLMSLGFQCHGWHWLIPHLNHFFQWQCSVHGDISGWIITTSLRPHYRWWLARWIISKWSYFRLVNYSNLPRYFSRWMPPHFNMFSSRWMVIFQASGFAEPVAALRRSEKVKLVGCGEGNWNIGNFVHR